MSDNASKPLVSVVLPTHNRADRLSRAITSVLAQTYTNLELIVVDDASQDSTEAVVRSFTDPRLRYLRLDHPHFASGARNAGIGVARGQFIAFQDDDDIWLVEKLDKQVRALVASGDEIGLNLCGHISLYQNRQALYVGGPKYYANVQPGNGYAKLSLIATPSWLVRSQVLAECGVFDECIRTLEDWELSLRLSERYGFSHLDEPLYVKSCGDQTSLSKSGVLFSKAMQMIMERHAAKWSGNPRITAFHYYLIGRFECVYHSTSVGRQWLGKAIARRPLYLKAWLALAVSWMGRDFNAALTKWIRSGHFRNMLPGKTHSAGVGT